MHKEDSARKGTAKVLVAVIRISTHCTFATPLRVRYLGRHAVLLGNKLLGNLSDGVDGEGEPVVLFGVCVQTHQIMTK